MMSFATPMWLDTGHNDPCERSRTEGAVESELLPGRITRTALSCVDHEPGVARRAACSAGPAVATGWELAATQSNANPRFTAVSV